LLFSLSLLAVVMLTSDFCVFMYLNMYVCTYYVV
jgi:hypothetical protein